MTVQYIADDGKIFNTLEECHEYEVSITKPLFTALLSICGYTTEGKRVYTPGEDVNNEWNRLWDESAFLHLIRDLTDEEVEKVGDCFGYSLPHKRGVYRWNEYCWISYKSDYADFQKLWAPVNILLG